MPRSRLNTLRFSILPWVLGALVLRAMIPAGFMHAPGLSLEVAMCAPADPTSTELIEIPGTEPQVHCDACLLPTIAVPPALATRVVPVNAADSPLPHPDIPTSRFALTRAQLARAPPA